MDPQRAQGAIGLVDLTNLDIDCDEQAIDSLCERAVRHGTAAVCVWPDFVERSAAGVADSPVRVATVVNFPTGNERAHAVGVITERAITDGADEIDVVLPYRDFQAGREGWAASVLDTVRGVAGQQALMKVILETGETPTLEGIAQAARFAIDHGADFIKTSTGKTEVSATPAAVAVMLDVISNADRPVGLKPSGGIRSAADAKLYLDLAEEMMGDGWISPDTFRFGASGLLDALVAVVQGRQAHPTITEAY